MEERKTKSNLSKADPHPHTQNNFLILSPVLNLLFAVIVYIRKIIFHLLQFWVNLLSWPHPINGQEVFAQEMVS